MQTILSCKTRSRTLISCSPCWSSVINFENWSPGSRTRDKDAALRFVKKALKRHRSPDAITTDSLRSYRAAVNKLGIAESRKSDAGPTTGWRTATSHFEDASVRYSGQANEVATEVRLCPSQHLQPLLSRTPPRRPVARQKKTPPPPLSSGDEPKWRRGSRGWVGGTRPSYTRLPNRRCIWFD